MMCVSTFSLPNLRKHFPGSLFDEDRTVIKAIIFFYQYFHRKIKSYIEMFSQFFCNRLFFFNYRLFSVSIANLIFLAAPTSCLSPAGSTEAD